VIIIVAQIVADTLLLVSDESIIGREGGWDCTPRAKSDIYDCLSSLCDRCMSSDGITELV